MSDSGDSDHIYPALVTILRRVEISSLGWYDNNKSLLILTLGDAVEDWRGWVGWRGHQNRRPDFTICSIFDNRIQFVYPGQN